MTRIRLLAVLMIAGFGCSADPGGSGKHLSKSTVTLCQGIYCPDIQICPDGTPPAMLPGECCETCAGSGGGTGMCDPSFGICQTDADCPQPQPGGMVTISCQNGCCLPSDPNPCPISLPCPDGSIPVYWNGQCQCKQPPIPGQCCDGTFGECMSDGDCPSFPGANVQCINGCCTPGAPPPPCDPNTDPTRCCVCPQPPPCPPGQTCPPVPCECPPPPPPCDPTTGMCPCVCPAEPCMVNPDGSVTCPPCDCPPPPPPCMPGDPNCCIPLPDGTCCIPDSSTGQCCVPDPNGNCCTMGSPNCPPPPPPPCDPNTDPTCCDPATGQNCCMPGDPNCPPPPPPPCDPNTDPTCCDPSTGQNCCMPGDPNCPPQPVRLSRAKQPARSTGVK